jgi:hypothetical protein
MWSQVIGKICLQLTAPVNHFWNIAWRVTPNGLSTPPLHQGSRAFLISFDFIRHRLEIASDTGSRETVDLVPQTVADFYREVMARLPRLGLTVRIWSRPVEVPDPVPFEKDVQHRAYDRDAVHALSRILVSIHPILESFRGEFIGKCSPVHFFWGSFDLAVTRFSGRRAPERPGADPITREAYSHEVISHGFWPGGAALREPAFYAYAAPEPAGFKEAPVRPAAAFYSTDLSEFILPYESVRTARTPAADLTAFLKATYDAGAELAQWNRTELERR